MKLHDATCITMTYHGTTRHQPTQRIAMGVAETLFLDKPDKLDKTDKLDKPDKLDKLDKLDTPMSERLTTELISDPSLWRLAVELRSTSIEVVIHSLLHDNSLIRRSIPIDTTTDTLTALSNAVYDNPLLLSDFGHTDVLVESRRIQLVPDSLKSEDLRQDVMSVLWPEQGYSVIANDITSSGETLLIGIDPSLLAFVRRTFPLCRIMHRLTPIVTYFYNKDRLNSTAKMYVHLLADSIDVVLVRDGKLQVVNTFSASAVDDMVYYILAVAKASGFSVTDDEIMLCGLPAVRDQVMPELRKFVRHVMPVLFPSTMLSMGREALEAPFELIILPLCE